MGRITKSYLYASSVSTHDATMTYTYANGQLDTITDFEGNVTDYDYDDQGRVSKVSADANGIDAETTFTYDNQGQKLTTTSPTSIVTRTEHNDFGEVVLEKGPSFGDIHRQYDEAGRLIQRRESKYDSALNNQNHCYDYDWLGRMTARDNLCNGTDNVTLYYDGDSSPSGGLRHQHRSDRPALDAHEQLVQARAVLPPQRQDPLRLHEDDHVDVERLRSAWNDPLL